MEIQERGEVKREIAKANISFTVNLCPLAATGRRGSSNRIRGEDARKNRRCGASAPMIRLDNGPRPPVHQVK